MSESASDRLRTRYAEVYRFARRRVSSRSAAEDLTQQAFLEASAGPRRDGSLDLGLLLTIVRRRVIDELRRPQVRLVPLDAAQPVESVGHETGLSAQVVSQAIDRLDPIQRDVVVLKLLRGLSFGEVAEVVGATEAACKMRFRRGMDRLRDDLEKRGVDS